MNLNYRKITIIVCPGRNLKTCVCSDWWCRSWTPCPREADCSASFTHFQYVLPAEQHSSLVNILSGTLTNSVSIHSRYTPSYVLSVCTPSMYSQHVLPVEQHSSLDGICLGTLPSTLYEEYTCTPMQSTCTSSRQYQCSFRNPHRHSIHTTHTPFMYSQQSRGPIFRRFNGMP